MMTRFWRCGLSTMMSFAVVISVALAQQPGPFPGGMMGALGGLMAGGGDLQLVANPAVQKELNLTAKQKGQLRSVDEAAKASRQELFAAIRENGIDPEAVGEQMTAIRQELDAKVIRVLDKTQKTRLAQIKLQRDGMTAISRSEVASKLKITNPQSKQIKKVMETMNKEIAAAMPKPPEGIPAIPGGFPFGGGPGGPPGDFGPPGAGDEIGKGGTAPKKKGGNNAKKKADAGNEPNGAEGPGGPGEPAAGKVFGGPGPAGPQFEEFRTKMQEGFQNLRKARESAAKQIEAILTADQKTAWAKMTGEPFDVSALQQIPGGPGGMGGPREKGAPKKTEKDADDNQ